MIPFAVFILGYAAFFFLMPEPEFTVPNVVGESLQNSMKLLSKNGLNIRIIAEKDDANLLDNTIITQHPQDAKVRKNQTVYVSVSKRPKARTISSFEGKKLEDVEKVLKKEGLKYKIIKLPSCQPQNNVIAQNPEGDEPIQDNKVIIFTSKSEKKPVIWPNFKGLGLNDVIDVLKNYDITPEIKREEGTTNSIIIDQKPIPGSIVYTDKVKVLFKIG